MTENPDGAVDAAKDDYVRIKSSGVTETGREFSIEVEARGQPARELDVPEVLKNLREIREAMEHDRKQRVDDALARDPAQPMKLGAAVAAGFLVAILIAGVWTPLPAIIVAAVSSIALYTIIQVFYLRSVDGLSEAGTIELVRYALLNFLAPLLRGR